jgi:hypothetical protein
MKNIVLVLLALASLQLSIAQSMNNSVLLSPDKNSSFSPGYSEIPNRPGFSGNVNAQLSDLSLVKLTNGSILVYKPTENKKNATANTPLKREPAMQQFHKKMLTSLMQGNQNKAAMKATSVLSERVIAISNRDNTLGALNDSVNFRYGANKGSAYDFNTMIYAYNYPYNTSPVFNFAGIFTKPQVYFDTMMHWEVNPNTLTYGYYETDYATYNTNKCLTGYTELFKDSAIFPKHEIHQQIYFC